MEAMGAGDTRWREGRAFSLVYLADEDVLEVLHGAATRFFSENALNPMAFPSLRRFESEVLAMGADLLGLPEAAGAMTSGGTESILMAVKTARDWARKQQPHIKAPEMVLPVSVHPAFIKAAKYFDVTPVITPVGADFRADVAAIEAAITDNTILLVGSAPSYPQGVIDPIEAIAGLAQKRGLLCHVDACVGGYQLPFLRKLGRPIPPFDFRVPGVTSMSADLHKYGYAAKGASTIFYRTRELRRMQHVAYADWTGGLYVSPGLPGTRPSGPIAAAWAIMNFLGEDGYVRLTKRALDAMQAIRAGVGAIEGLTLLGEPDATMFAFGSDSIDVYALADALTARGWHLDRQQRPASLHLSVMPGHLARVDEFLSDLRACVEGLRGGGPVAEGTAAMYGMLGTLPDRGAVTELLLDFIDGLDAS
ncbi:MAG: aspartate aminotransferase family protein [Myxococcales bacterium]|nr:MAG: aspartate aminotransferase family protein [Myxococcales bacterium]